MRLIEDICDALVYEGKVRLYSKPGMADNKTNIKLKGGFEVSGQGTVAGIRIRMLGPKDRGTPQNRDPPEIVLIHDGRGRSFISRKKGTNELNRMLWSGYETDGHQTISSADVYVLSRRPPETHEMEQESELRYDTDNPKVRSLIGEYSLTYPQARRMAMHIDGMTFEEIAAAEGITSDAVRPSIDLARVKMLEKPK